jgi:hypothetical protein
MTGLDALDRRRPSIIRRQEANLGISGITVPPILLTRASASNFEVNGS